MQLTQKEWIGFGLTAAGFACGLVSTVCLSWHKPWPELIGAVTAVAGSGLGVLASVWAAYNHITAPTVSK